MGERFPALKKKYSGAPYIIDGALDANLGEGRTIFMEHMSDLFAKDVPNELIFKVLDHCKQWPRNTYVFQSKNPSRISAFIGLMPCSVILGTTIETNRPTQTVSSAPSPEQRYNAMLSIRCTFKGVKTFVTIEPILAFDLGVLAGWIADLRPDFLNIGADSKKRGLTEPTKAEVLALVAELRKAGIEVREKHNLDRMTA
jgi:hypothetical protein